MVTILFVVLILHLDFESCFFFLLLPPLSIYTAEPLAAPYTILLPSFWHSWCNMPTFNGTYILWISKYLYASNSGDIGLKITFYHFHKATVIYECQEWRVFTSTVLYPLRALMSLFCQIFIKMQFVPSKICCQKCWVRLGYLSTLGGWSGQMAWAQYSR